MGVRPEHLALGDGALAGVSPPRSRWSSSSARKSCWRRGSARLASLWPASRRDRSRPAIRSALSVAARPIAFLRSRERSRDRRLIQGTAA